MKEETKKQQGQKGTKKLSNDELLNATGGSGGGGCQLNECEKKSVSVCNSNPKCEIKTDWFGKQGCDYK